VEFLNLRMRWPDTFGVVISLSCGNYTSRFGGMKHCSKSIPRAADVQKDLVTEYYVEAVGLEGKLKDTALLERDVCYSSLLG
jgi:hypothetical protein